MLLTFSLKNDVPGTQATPTFSAISRQKSTSDSPLRRYGPMSASTKYAPCGSVKGMPICFRPSVNSFFMWA